MDDSLFVRRTDRFGNLPRIVQGGLDGQRTFKGGAFHQLHHERFRFHTVNLPNIRMIQRCKKLRFTPKPGESLGVPSHRLWQDFDGNFAPQSGVLRAIHFAHSSHTDGRQDFVGAEPIAGRKRHVFDSAKCSRSESAYVLFDGAC